MQRALLVCDACAHRAGRQQFHAVPFLATEDQPIHCPAPRAVHWPWIRLRSVHRDRSPDIKRLCMQWPRCDMAEQFVVVFGGHFVLSWIPGGSGVTMIFWLFGAAIAMALSHSISNSLTTADNYGGLGPQWGTGRVPLHSWGVHGWVGGGRAWAAFGAPLQPKTPQKKKRCRAWQREREVQMVWQVNDETNYYSDDAYEDGCSKIILLDSSAPRSMSNLIRIPVFVLAPLDDVFGKRELGVEGGGANGNTHSTVLPIQGLPPNLMLFLIGATLESRGQHVEWALNTDQAEPNGLISPLPAANRAPRGAQLSFLISPKVLRTPVKLIQKIFFKTQNVCEGSYNTVGFLTRGTPPAYSWNRRSWRFILKLSPVHCIQPVPRHGMI
ncbi:hypothetical protein B0H17DRAFT_1149565 [Mycena rosella]|uniref:Uncharacterized protein n=1 Tax=Mycena rosella TaxID=1033263 RepID=A0AAD7FRZ9_MYCRO|nr:hypothetical protein B0H17DRAFT_1149565 [Mycena rosella]